MMIHTLPCRSAMLVLLTALSGLSSCTKTDDTTPAYTSVNNTSWTATVTVGSTTTEQNIFEFSNGGNSFSWHPAAAGSYYGTWTQDKDKVSFVFKETVGTADYYWDNSATLSSDGTTLTGTMQRRGAQGSATFIAKKL